VAYLVGNSLGKKEVLLQTGSALMRCECRDDGLISVEMGIAKTHWQDIPLSQDIDTQSLPISHGGYSQPAAVSMGNPHAIFFVEDVEQVALEEVGAAVEHDTLFPERTNVEFAQIIDSGHIKLRVWERGSGVTQACGSGACATVVAASLLHDMAPSVAVDLPGGRLWVEVDEQLFVTMTGPVAEVFSGELKL
jgi:diaminopimelate epimerase